MKPTMLFAIVMLTSIVLMTTFDLQLAPTKALQVSTDIAPNVLYVCPAASHAWDTIASAMTTLKQPIIIAFFFGAIILLFSWAWAMYQNLLKDKFNRDSFKAPWSFTKFGFWALVIILMLMMTPNHFRTVHIQGAKGDWVLCENNTPGARAVRADVVKP